MISPDQRFDVAHCVKCLARLSRAKFDRPQATLRLKAQQRGHTHSQQLRRHTARHDQWIDEVALMQCVALDGTAFARCVTG
jgi:hypothetical protein